MKSLISTLTLSSLFLGSLAFAAPRSEMPNSEAMCRIKAKEIAAESFRSCVTEVRTTQIDQVKKDYQDKLRAMKEEYEREIKRLSQGGAPAAEAPADEKSGEPADSKTTKKTVLPTKKVASKKPARTPKVNPVTVVTVKPNAPVTVTPSDVSEVNVALKPAANSLSDDSTLDIPEPTAVEELPN